MCCVFEKLQFENIWSLLIHSAKFDQKGPASYIQGYKCWVKNMPSIFSLNIIFNPWMTGVFHNIFWLGVGGTLCPAIITTTWTKIFVKIFFSWYYLIYMCHQKLFQWNTFKKNIDVAKRKSTEKLHFFLSSKYFYISTLASENEFAVNNFWDEIEASNLLHMPTYT